MRWRTGRLTMRIEIAQEAFGSAGWREMVGLRTRVLRDPLGLAYSEAQLAEERTQIHLALRVEGALAGTLLLPPDWSGTAKLRQMAVAPAWSKQGFGRRLVLHGEGVLRDTGARAVRLSARETAIGFYERLGYAAEGPFYREVTLPHRLMRKSL